jgi:hypothetical protein
MAVDERARHQLHSRLDDVLGPEVTGTLMELLPPVGWADVATKQDLAMGLDGLRVHVDAQVAGIRTEMADLRTEMSELRAGMTELRAEVATGAIEVRADVRTGLAEVRSELRREMAANQRQMMFGMFGAIAANAGVVWAALAFAT